MSLRCSLGIHVYLWSDVTETSCLQELVCSLCGHRSGQTREFHEYSEWKAADRRYDTSLVAGMPFSESSSAAFGYTFQTIYSSRTCARCLHVDTKEEVSCTEEKVFA
jgi:hypothetical protein